MNPIAMAVADVTQSLAESLLLTLDGIPDEILASWKPAFGHRAGNEINTFAAIAVHTASAGSWMLFHQVLGDEMTRDRESEFHAVATRAEIDHLYEQWMRAMRERLAELDTVDLAQMPPTIRESRKEWNRAHWLLHMVDHTAIHLGHMQLQRQLWDAESQPAVSDRSSIH